MRIAIIGGGFTGLAAGWQLIKDNHEVVIYESGKYLGGLASGFMSKDWNWSLEKFYHHVFTNDKEIIQLAEEIGWPMKEYSPVTNSFIDGHEWRLDSPISVIKFSPISLWGRLRMGAGLAALKVINNGEFLEKYLVEKMLPALIGKEGYQLVWEKLLKAKFGKYLKEVNMAWFWSRVNKRTKNLGYFEGGFQKLVDRLAERIVEKGGKIENGKEIKSLRELKGFDKIIVTTPAPIADKLLGGGVVKWPKIDYLWGQTVVLQLNKSLMNGYWLNILENDWPFLVAVEHTNMVDKNNYGEKVIIYLGNYLEESDKRLQMSDNDLLDSYIPYLKKINKKFDRGWVDDVWRFKAPFAQPVFPTNYRRQIPNMETGIDGVYVANMSMVYPWDRGVNYAVLLGQQVAKMVNDSRN